MLRRASARVLSLSGMKKPKKTRSTVAGGLLVEDHHFIEKGLDDEWSKAMPFRSMPGPKPIPLLGNKWRALPYIGNFDPKHMDVSCKRFYEEYGPVVKVSKMASGDIVILYEADDIEKLLRGSEHMPDRPVISSLYYYKTVLRKDFFGDHQGVVGVEVDVWSRFRPKVHKDMLQPKIVKLYDRDIERSAVDFLNRIEAIKDANEEVPGDFMFEINKWALESIGSIALDTRLGCLDPKPPQDSEVLLDAVRMFLVCTSALELKFPFWRFFNTPTWNKYVNALDTFLSIILDKIKDVVDRGVGDKPMNQWSLLERMLDSNADEPKVAAIMAFDMFLVGIDTISLSMSSALYELTKYPEVQERIYQEICQVSPDPDAPMTAEKLESMQYLKGTIKEVLRLVPPVIGNGRRLTSNLVINGYQIPKGVRVVYQSLVSSKSDRHYKHGEKFMPERWIKQENQCPASANSEDDVTKPKFHPFSYIPFGYGKRMCLGKRFADLELQMLLCKLIRAYKIEYHHEELEYITEPFYTLSGPLRFKFKRRT